MRKSKKFKEITINVRYTKKSNDSAVFGQLIVANDVMSKLNDRKYGDHQYSIEVCLSLDYTHRKKLLVFP